MHTATARSQIVIDADTYVPHNTIDGTSVRNSPKVRLANDFDGDAHRSQPWNLAMDAPTPNSPSQQEGTCLSRVPISSSAESAAPR
jgi:hypothetical protein